MPSRAPCAPGCGCRKHVPRRRSHARWPEDQLKPCGTLAALRRHHRRGEPVDEACRQAERREHRTGERMEQAIDRREIRNGIPWKPYQYRGLGYDQLTAWMDDMERAS